MYFARKVRVSISFSMYVLVEILVEASYAEDWNRQDVYIYVRWSTAS